MGNKCSLCGWDLFEFPPGQDAKASWGTVHFTVNEKGEKLPKPFPGATCGAGCSTPAATACTNGSCSAVRCAEHGGV